VVHALPGSPARTARRTATPSAPLSRARYAAVVVGLGAVLLGAAGCSGSPPTETAPGPDGAPAAPPPPPPAACLLDTGALAETTGLTWAPDAVTASDTRCVYDPSPAAPAAAAAETGAGGSAREGAAEGRDQSPPEDAAAAAAGTGSAEFVAVDVTAAPEEVPAAQLDVLAQVCESGTRTATTGSGFVCRLPGGSVFAALVSGDRVVTVAASDVPEGTTAAALVIAFGQQLDALG
jgi:hypothetical protein